MNKLNATPLFAESVLAWFDEYGRKDLPWQQQISPYRVWVSEIMLQQTQVKTVIPYFEAFMTAFPSLLDLANATQDKVLKHWSGLGYYARARNMHNAAQQVRDHFKGVFPDGLVEVQSLPGIGRSTAGAILSIAHQQSHAILDGNVKRVLTRFFGVEGWPGKAAVQKQLWLLAEHLLPKNVPRQRNADYTQAMMDLGATVCTRGQPVCDSCPLRKDCFAIKQNKVLAYPTAKPKMKLPTKQTVMLIIKKGEYDVLMHKRVSMGIWGGLWCFPQFDDEQGASEWLSERFAMSDVDAWQLAKPLEPLSHTFSHFRLHIQPYQIVLKRNSQTPLKLGVMETDSRLWYNMMTEFQGGLAAPVNRLLNQLRKQI